MSKRIVVWFGWGKVLSPNPKPNNDKYGHSVSVGDIVYRERSFQKEVFFKTYNKKIKTKR